MEFLRTPDERFEGLSGYEFAPHYVEVPPGDSGTGRLQSSAALSRRGHG